MIARTSKDIKCGASLQTRMQYVSPVFVLLVESVYCCADSAQTPLLICRQTDGGEFRFKSRFKDIESFDPGVIRSCVRRN